MFLSSLTFAKVTFTNRLLKLSITLYFLHCFRKQMQVNTGGKKSDEGSASCIWQLSHTQSCQTHITCLYCHFTNTFLRVVLSFEICSFVVSISLRVEVFRV